MLKFELLEIMTVEQFVKFVAWNNTLPKLISYVGLPDGRKLDWYDEHDVHTFMTTGKGEAIETTCERGGCVQGTKPVVVGDEPTPPTYKREVELQPDDNIS